MSKLILGFIDDQPFFFEMLKYLPEDKFATHTFLDPLDFVEACENDDTLAKSLDYIFVDMVAANWDNLENKFALSFREAFPDFDGQIVLYSSKFGKTVKPKNIHGFDFFLIKKDVWPYLNRLAP